MHRPCMLHMSLTMCQTGSWRVIDGRLEPLSTPAQSIHYWTIGSMHLCGGVGGHQTAMQHGTICTSAPCDNDP